MTSDKIWSLFENTLWDPWVRTTQSLSAFSVCDSSPRRQGRPLLTPLHGVPHGTLRMRVSAHQNVLFRTRKNLGLLLPLGALSRRPTHRARTTRQGSGVPESVQTGAEGERGEGACVNEHSRRRGSNRNPEWGWTSFLTKAAPVSLWHCT